MVRKRSRTSRKHYDSDDNDTDSDFALNDPPAEPAAKKYSLRQRKRSLFLADYEYEDDEEIPPPKHESEDEDFEVDADVVTNVEPNSNNAYINHIEPESIPEEPDELIDFEDVIRADIVVNKNRIDYDNIITKTEIKLQPSSQTSVIPPPTKSRRGRKPRGRPRRQYEGDFIGHIYQPEPEVQDDGSDYELPVRTRRERKPKIRPETEVDSSILEPEMDVQEEYDDANDKDYDPSEDIDEENRLLTCVQAEIQEVNASPLNSNIPPNLTADNMQAEPEINHEKEAVKAVEDKPVEIVEDGNSSNKENNDSDKNESVVENTNNNKGVRSPCSIEQVSQSNETEEEDKVGVVQPILPEEANVQKHPYNSVIKFNEKPTVAPASQTNGSSSQLENAEVQLELKEEIRDDSDDDVVLIEEKNTEVIVLDD